MTSPSSITERTTLHKTLFTRAIQGEDPHTLAVEYLLACDPSAGLEDLDPREVEQIAEQLTPIPGVHI